MTDTNAVSFNFPENNLRFTTLKTIGTNFGNNYLYQQTTGSVMMKPNSLVMRTNLGADRNVFQRNGFAMVILIAVRISHFIKTLNVCGCSKNDVFFYIVITQLMEPMKM